MAAPAGKPPSPLWMGVTVLLVAALAALGFIRGGANLGLLYGLGGLVVGVSLVSIERAVRVHKALNRAQPDAPSSLAPTQTLSILAAAAGHGGPAPNFSSPVLEAVKNLEEAAQADPVAALAEAESLTRAHPTSAALMAKRAEIERDVGRIRQAVETAGRAIEMALNGGSAPVAVTLARAFEAHAALVPLAPAVRSRLGVVLEARDHSELASAYSTGPEPDEGSPEDSPEDSPVSS